DPGREAVDVKVAHRLPGAQDAGVEHRRLNLRAAHVEAHGAVLSWPAHGDLHLRALRTANAVAHLLKGLPRHGLAVDADDFVTRPESRRAGRTIEHAQQRRMPGNVLENDADAAELRLLVVDLGLA